MTTASTVIAWLGKQEQGSTMTNTATAQVPAQTAHLPWLEPTLKIEQQCRFLTDKYAFFQEVQNVDRALLVLFVCNRVGIEPFRKGREVNVAQVLPILATTRGISHDDIKAANQLLTELVRVRWIEISKRFYELTTESGQVPDERVTLQALGARVTFEREQQRALLVYAQDMIGHIAFVRGATITPDDQKSPPSPTPVPAPPVPAPSANHGRNALQVLVGKAMGTAKSLLIEQDQPEPIVEPPTPLEPETQTEVDALADFWTREPILALQGDPEATIMELAVLPLLQGADRLTIQEFFQIAGGYDVTETTLPGILDRLEDKARRQVAQSLAILALVEDAQVLWDDEVGLLVALNDLLIGLRKCFLDRAQLNEQPRLDTAVQA